MRGVIGRRGEDGREMNKHANIISYINREEMKNLSRFCTAR
jgi:hypothetical protein